MARLFNESELLERIDNDMAFLGETVEMLENDGPPLLAQVKSALAAADAPSAGKYAHTLKGMISNFCAPSVQALAFEVERAGKAGDGAAASAAMVPLEKSLEQLIAELRSYVTARTS